MFESGEASSINHQASARQSTTVHFSVFWILERDRKKKKNGSMRLNTEFHIFVSVLGNLVISRRNTLFREEDGD